MFKNFKKKNESYKTLKEILKAINSDNVGKKIRDIKKGEKIHIEIRSDKFDYLKKILSGTIFECERAMFYRLTYDNVIGVYIYKK